MKQTWIVSTTGRLLAIFPRAFVALCFVEAREDRREATNKSRHDSAEAAIDAIFSEEATQ